MSSKEKQYYHVYSIKLSAIYSYSYSQVIEPKTKFCNDICDAHNHAVALDVSVHYSSVCLTAIVLYFIN